MVQTFLSGNINTKKKNLQAISTVFFFKSISLNLYKCQVYDIHVTHSIKALYDIFVHVLKEYKC